MLLYRHFKCSFYHGSCEIQLKKKRLHASTAFKGRTPVYCDKMFEEECTDFYFFIFSTVSIRGRDVKRKTEPEENNTPKDTMNLRSVKMESKAMSLHFLSI